MIKSNFINEKIILPLGDLVTGNSVSKHFKFLMKTQWWDKQRIIDYQNKKLQKLIFHSYSNVPYYKDLFDRNRISPYDIKTKNDLVNIPLLTKEQIKIGIKDKSLIAKNYSLNDLVINSSSGSTGEPLKYYSTKESYSFNLACGIRSWYWMGYKLGDKYAKLSFNPRNNFFKKIQDKMNNCVLFVLTSLDCNEIKNLIYELKISNVKFIRSYPSSLDIISKYILENDINDFKIEAISTTGEILFSDQKKNIEKAFNCNVYDTYSSEGVSIFSQINHNGGYYGSDEYSITEIIDDKKINSEEGKLITTDLWNYATPFIRYDVNDFVIKSNSNARSLICLQEIKGRDVDTLITIDNKKLIVHFFTIYFSKYQELKQFQVIQTDIKNIVIKIVPENNYNNNIENKILIDIKEYIGKKTNLKIERVQSIKSDSSGKRRFMKKNFNFS